MLPKLPGSVCVWMRAGVIRFWLCDRDFDCENCPLDAALSDRRPSSFRDAPVRSHTPGEEPVPAGRPPQR